MYSNKLSDLSYSVLDLATVVAGQSIQGTYHNSLEIAQHAEKSGYTRYWFAEHHNMPNVASSATAVLIGYVAGGTKTIRVGSGGIMLPNHAPLIIAEQFGTLASLYPNRIDLGLGRAPGTDQVTAMAIRGENFNASHYFPEDVQSLQDFFSADNYDAKVRAIPGEGIDIPIWILGSSTDSARLAASKGLPYAFASHFAPTYFLEAIELYRRNFKPSEHLKEPYVMACVNVVMADTDEEAEYISTSVKQLFMGIVTGKRKPLQPPVHDMRTVWNDIEKEAVMQMLAYSFIGGPEKIKRDMQAFVDKTGINEVMATSHIYDHKARLRSYQLLAEALK